MSNQENSTTEKSTLNTFFDFVINTSENLFRVLKYSFKYFFYLTSSYINVNEKIQLTFIYFFAFVDLVYSVFTLLIVFGSFPAILEPLTGLLHSILESRFLQLWASPEKVFLISYFVLELLIIRNVFKLSKLVQYNILLIFSVIMLQGLTISFWDALFHRDMGIDIAKWTFDQGTVLHTDKVLAIFFFLFTFVVFTFLYIYFYFKAIQGKFATLPYFEFVTDSVSFWLRIRTSTMKFGKRKKKGKGKKN
jgi:hypothetical protein